MTVTINLPPGTESEVAALASAKGLAIEDYLPRFIQRALPSSQPSHRQGSEEWLNLLNQPPPVARIASAAEQALSAVSDDSLRRENLYEDRA
jgi:hypothetical protein